MKKVLACLMALLMMALPALGMAELPTLSVNQGFSAKYVAEGQGETVDISVQLGDSVLSGMDEQTRGIIQELLDALKIEVETQKNGADLQGALRILLNDQKAADVVVALGEKGLYAASSFLGEKTLMFTPEQIKQFAEQMLDQMAAQGTISQEQADQLKGALNGASGGDQDPFTALFGSPDLAPLMAALTELVPAEPEVTAVEEIPEGVTIDAVAKMTIVLSKEAMTKLTTELAKLLWSMPVVQKVAETVAAKNGGEPLTEEKLIETLNRLPAVFSDDLAMDVYMDATGQQIQVLSDMEITAKGQTVPVSVNALTEMKENGMHMHEVVRVAAAEEPMTMNMDMNVAADGADTTVDVEVLMESEKDGQAVTVMQETVHMVVSESETEKTIVMEIAVRMAQDGSSQPMAILYNINGTETDLGDHAEEKVTMTAAIDGLGDLFTMTMDSKTNPAEAWIITDDAVQPLSMAAEEQQQLLSELSGSAMTGLLQLIGNLPAAAQSLVVQLMNGGAQ